jgi:hypothetical protein
LFTFARAEGQGMALVTITDENGRIFEVQDFAQFFAGDY